MADANLKVLNGDGSAKYIKEHGAGTDLDPHIPAVSVESGGVASGAVASGAVASGAIASGALASGSISDGADVTQGAKADNRSDKTDTTAVTIMSVLKEISYMEQNPASRAVTLATAPALVAGSAAIGKIITPSFSASDSITRPANANVYAANKSINCSVAVTVMAYAGRVVTLTAANAFAVGDHITVAGVNIGFTVSNIDGNWICKAGTNATTVVFDVDVQPVGATPQTISVGTIAKSMSFDVGGVVGGGIILSRISVALPGVAMTGAVRAWIYTVQPTVLVDQATFTLLVANDAYRKDYFDLYPVTEGSGSDVTFASLRLWETIKCEPADTHLFVRLSAEGAGTPASGGVVTVRLSGIQLLG